MPTISMGRLHMRSTTEQAPLPKAVVPLIRIDPPKLLDALSSEMPVFGGQMMLTAWQVGL